MCLLCQYACSASLTAFLKGVIIFIVKLDCIPQGCYLHRRGSSQANAWTDPFPSPCICTDLNGQPPKEDVYLIRAAGPTPRACPDANLITANAYCYWTGQFSLKPFEGAHQAWIVRRTNSSSGSYYVTNYYRQSVASPACERNVWNFQPQCGNTDIDL